MLGDSSCIISACCPKSQRKLVERVNLSTDEFIISMIGSCRKTKTDWSAAGLSVTTILLDEYEIVHKWHDLSGQDEK